MRTTTRGAGSDPVPERDRVLTGAPSARKVFREIAAQPGSAVRLDVVGPGGSGKTTLLDALADTYRQATVTVIRQVGELPDGEEIADAAVLIDDAHLLADDELDRLRSLAGTGRPRLVVAHRPWPSTAAMSRLGAMLTRGRPPLVLGALDRAGVASRMALMFGVRPSVELVENVTERTAGMPSLVDRLLRALRSSGAVEVSAGSEPRMQVAVDLPPGLLEQIRYDLAGLPKPVLKLLLAVAVGAPLDGEVLAPTLNLPAEQVSDLVEEARAAGLLGGEGRLAPLVRMALVQHTAELQVQSVRQRLAEVQLERGGNVLVVARGLLGTGASGERIATLFVTAGDEALRGGDPLAYDYYAAAVEAGAVPAPLAARRAHAAAAVGDLDAALRLADTALADPATPAPERARAVAVAATVAAQRGMLARTAQLYGWLASTGASTGPGAVGNPEIAAAAVPALLGIGALHEAREVLNAPNSVGSAGPPTVLSGAEMLIARGIVETIEGSATAGLSQLARASALLEPAGPSVLLPDTPSALAALVAAQCGELDVAQSVLDRAVAARLGGPATAARHRLLQAWIVMQRGATARARTLLTGVRSAVGRLEPRDEFLAASLEVGLARRAGELPALISAWGRAREGIVRYPVDLYALHPLGELVVGAARLREQAWVQPHLDEAHALLAQLGDPPLWAAPLHWASLQASILSQDVESAERHADALQKDSASGRYVAALAVAARLWLRIAAEDIDAAEVEAGARGLHAVGLTWEGGRLAGQAAIRTRDRKDMTALLSCARALQGGASAAAPAAPAAAGSAMADAQESGGAAEAAAESTDGTLSDREREVAELVLAGLTYKQIGEQLFISAKTVEHHVARIRQRLGSASRGELFAHLRSLIGAPTAHD